MHSSEAFIACDDPLEAAIFSVLVEIKNIRRIGDALRKYLILNTRKMVY